VISTIVRQIFISINFWHQSETLIVDFKVFKKSSCLLFQFSLFYVCACMHAWHSRLYLSKAGTRFSDPGGMLGWVDLVVWLWGYEELLSGCILMRDWRVLWVQSLLRLHEEMVAEGCIHNELVNTALPVCQRHDSVTTASQTDLSGEVSLHHTCKHAPVSLICMSWEAPDLFTRQCSKGHYCFCMCLSFCWASCMNGRELRC